ncbi:MAG: hypothetical protein AB9900_04905 [Humidesulfovibrio sp.]
MTTIDGFFMVPKVAARLSLGGGSWEVGAEIRGHYAFRAVLAALHGQSG